MKELLKIPKMIIVKILKSTKRLFLNLQQIYFHLAGSKVECNICHYKANKLSSAGWHSFASCPYCSSNVRHRLLMASFSNLDKFSFEKILKNKKVLHFAPEKSLGKILREKSKEYKTADFLAEGYSYDKIDFNIDISKMNAIKNETFDCVIACDVLEHVPDHREGIKEVHRILTPGGYCIFTVPQKDHLKTTFEDHSITDKKERERVFGQHNHLRIYGDDFITMLQDAGFEVTAVDESYFDKKMVEQFVLFPPVLSKNPLATNYRKIFFGEKRIIHPKEKDLKQNGTESTLNTAIHRSQRL